MLNGITQKLLVLACSDLRIILILRKSSLTNFFVGMQCQAISASPLKPLQPQPSSTLLNPNWHNWSDSYTHSSNVNKKVKSESEVGWRRRRGACEMQPKWVHSVHLIGNAFSSAHLQWNSTTLSFAFIIGMEMDMCNAAHVWLHHNLRGLGGGGCLASRYRELIISAFLPSTTFFCDFYMLTVKYGIWQWLIVAHTISWDVGWFNAVWRMQ